MAGLGGRDVTMRGMPSPGGGMDSIFGSPPVRSGPSAANRAGFDPLFANFTNGPSWGGADSWDPLLKVQTRGIMDHQAELEETANATAAIPRPYVVDEASSAVLDMNTGEQMIIFEEDRQCEMFFRNRDALERHDIVQDVTSFGSESLSAEELHNVNESVLRRTKPVDHHQQVRPMSLSRLNHYLRSENGRRRFGYMRDAKVLQRTFRFAGVQETQLLPEHRTRTEQTMALIIRGRCRFANIWIINGGVPAIGSELFLVFVRKRWTGLPKFRWPNGSRTDDSTAVMYVNQLYSDSDRALAKARRGVPWSLPGFEGEKPVIKGFVTFETMESAVLGASVQTERGRRTDFVAAAADAEEAPIDIAESLETESGGGSSSSSKKKSRGDDEPAFDMPASLDTGVSSLSLEEQRGAQSKRAKKPSTTASIPGDSYYWQCVPLVAPSKHCPPKRIHNNLNFRSQPIHVGKTLDNYGGDAGTVAAQFLRWKEVNHQAIFPEDDSDGFKKAYYEMPRIEVSLRTVNQMPGCL